MRLQRSLHAQLPHEELALFADHGLGELRERADLAALPGAAELSTGTSYEKCDTDRMAVPCWGTKVLDGPEYAHDTDAHPELLHCNADNCMRERLTHAHGSTREVPLSLPGHNVALRKHDALRHTQDDLHAQTRDAAVDRTERPE